jgi:cytochrome c-type biogenesis protein CcmH/NrfG
MLKESLQENDHQIAGWYHLGRAYHLTGDLKNAESAYYQTIAQDPNHTLAFAQLGVLDLADERLRQAPSSFRRSINNYPYNPVVWNNYGHALLFSDSTNAALAAYTMAISLDPDYANAFNNRGELLLYKQSEVSKGKNDFLSCLALDPDHIFSMHNDQHYLKLQDINDNCLNM